MCLLLGKNWKTASLREGSNQPLDRSWAWTFWDCDFDIPVDNAGESIRCSCLLVGLFVGWFVCLHVCLFICMFVCMYVCFVCLFVLFVCLFV